MRLSIENWLENQPVGIAQYYLIPKENKKFAIYSDFESTAALLYFLEEFLLLYAKCVSWRLMKLDNTLLKYVPFMRMREKNVR